MSSNDNTRRVCLVSMIESRKNRLSAAQQHRVDLAERVRARLPEIETAIFLGVRELADASASSHPAYLTGLERAVGATVSYAIATIQHGADLPSPMPAEASEQARRAAREGIKLETVLRRYAAGSKLLQEFIVIEADGLPSSFLAEILGEQGVMVDRFMDFVSVAYDTELEWIRRTVAQQRAEQIRRLVDGGSVVPPEDLDYDFGGWHVAMILKGRGAESLARAMSERLACRSLIAPIDEEVVAAWFGSPGNAGTERVERVFVELASKEVSATLGEARAGLDGWRLTYHEAQAALQVLLRKPGRLVRCRDVILEGAVLWDRQLATSLVQTFLAPLDDRGTGEVLRRTLTAYFEANRNVTSAAAALSLARPTVERHLRRVEEQLGQTLDACCAQVQVALTIEELMDGAVAR
jgi:hypothetical protein